MALTFSEGSIGGDIERVNLTQLEAFYGKAPEAGARRPRARPTCGSTTSSRAARTASPSRRRTRPASKSLLLINPHTSFFFRAEAQMVSDEGLNAYGAITWGQFFIYQGFNDRAGWMHTSSGVDNIDEYLETIVQEGRRVLLPVRHRRAAGDRDDDHGAVQDRQRAWRRRTFTVYRTHHGPIVREADGKWVSVRLMQEPLKALTQSYSRTKAKNYKAFRESMELHTNSSNNTIFADADGTIAYFHSNFIPKRDPKFDWTKPVDGSDPATEWNGVLSIDETPSLRNPRAGWLYNTNNWPWSAAGPTARRRRTIPPTSSATARTRAASTRSACSRTRRTSRSTRCIAAAYDSYLPAFAALIPALFKAWDEAPASNPLKTKLAEQIALLRGWDYRWSATSVPTSLAVFWGEEIGRRVDDAARAGGHAGRRVHRAASRAASSCCRRSSTASDKLTADFGTWKTPWGDINRFQRLTGDIVQPFNDAAPSIPVGFTSARWGSLASFGARTYPGHEEDVRHERQQLRRGRRVRRQGAGQGGHRRRRERRPVEQHFNDQAQRYATGDLRDVYFYRAQVDAHAERTYQPGK